MRVVLTCALLLLPTLASAQIYTTASTWEWSAPANLLDVADAQAATYKLYFDATATGPAITLTNVTCGPPKPGHLVATCRATLTPAMVTEVNRRRVVAVLTATVPGTAESAPSNPFVRNDGASAPGTLSIVP
jgi:hypothetical protein